MSFWKSPFWGVWQRWRKSALTVTTVVPPLRCDVVDSRLECQLVNAALTCDIVDTRLRVQIRGA